MCGPLMRDRAFYFGSLDYNPLGSEQRPERQSATGTHSRRVRNSGQHPDGLPEQPQRLAAKLGCRAGSGMAPPVVAVQGSQIPLGILPILAPNTATPTGGWPLSTSTSRARTSCADATCRIAPRRSTRSTDSCLLDAAPHHGLPGVHFRISYVQPHVDERSAGRLQPLQ